jgi:L-ribulose-5-phosphate 4-epimerase
MQPDNLKRQVHRANLDLVKHGLVLFTWGNASGIDRQEGLVAIKPSGVPYNSMQPEDMVLVELESGKTIGSKYKPSSDTATHLELYRAFPELGGVVHSHSKHATAWAQAGLDLPCFGTTHADYFYGAVPCLPVLSAAEIEQHYEEQTGLAISQYFRQKQFKPLELPGVLLQGHASFCWGQGVADAVHHAVVLEAIAEMATQTLQLNPNTKPIPKVLLEKHYQRKHGKNAYYGQRMTKS